MSVKNLILSFALHAGIILLAILGIAAISRQEYSDAPIFFEIVEMNEAAQAEVGNSQSGGEENLIAKSVAAKSDAVSSVASSPKVEPVQVPPKICEAPGKPKSNTAKIEAQNPLPIPVSDRHAALPEQPIPEMETISPAPSSGQVPPVGSQAQSAEVSQDPKSNAALQNQPPKSRAQIISQPQARNRITPVYPRSARRRQREGCVSIKARIARDGGVAKTEIAVSSGHADLDRAAAEAVATAEFAPAEENGQPTEGEVLLVFEFKLK